MIQATAARFLVLGGLGTCGYVFWESDRRVCSKSEVSRLWSEVEGMIEILLENGRKMNARVRVRVLININCAREHRNHWVGLVCILWH